MGPEGFEPSTTGLLKPSLSSFVRSVAI